MTLFLLGIFVKAFACRDRVGRNDGKNFSTQRSGTMNVTEPIYKCLILREKNFAS